MDKNIFKLFLLCFLQVLVNSQATDDGQCVMYGSAKSESGGGLLSFFSSKVLSKLYSGPAKPLTDPNDIEILKSLCPDLAKDGKFLTCCDHEQLLTLNSQLGDLVGNVLGSCPSCYHNYKQTFCQITCSPKQSKFLKINEVEESSNGQLVSSLDYHISTTFAEGMFNSCKNVFIPGSNTNAMTPLCAPYGASCTAQRLLGVAARLSPYTMNFKFGEEPVKSEDKVYIPFSEKVSPCTEAFNGVQCSCLDCPAVCKVAPPYPPEPEPWQIEGYDAMIFIAVLLFLLFVLSAVLVYLYICLWVRRRNAEEQRKPLSVTITGCDLGSLEEVEPLRTKHSYVPPSEDTSTTAETPDVEFVDDDSIGFIENLGASFEMFLNRIFTRWGTFCAKRPYIVIFIGLAISAIFCAGCVYFTVVTDPVELWATPGSRARVERDYYNEHFQPFFRTEQLIILPKDTSRFNDSFSGKLHGPVFRQEFLLEVLDLQNTLENLTAPMDDSVIGLKDICLRPMYPVTEACTIQTVLNYYQNDPANLKRDNYLEKFDKCTLNHLDPECFGTFGGPVEPHMVLGGFPDDTYRLSEALVITFVVRNSLQDEHRLKAEAWEKVFIDFLKSYSNPNMTLSYNSERSVQDELDRNSKGDIITVLVSYIIMFVYISISLGKAKTFSRLLVDSKITLGLSGVLIVVISALASVGLFSFLEIPATLIIIEVIPFLVLAVGVDNIFILVQAFQRDERAADENLMTQIGRIVGEVGPSMLLSSVSESCCFFLGALSDMPAVRIFALYAGTALLFDFFLQISCFISLLALDAKRQEDNRLDVCFCIQANQKQQTNDSNDGLLYTLFKNFYSPFLMKTGVRISVVLVFVAWACSSIAVVDKVEIGLDQELAMPGDSFVVDYITNLRKYLSVGPPLYFVVTDGYDYSIPENQNRICNRDAKCNWDSMLSQLDIAAERSNRSYIAKGGYSWLDTYFSFMQGSCCKVFDSNNSYCPSTHQGSDCSECPANSVNGRPDSESFHKFLPNFLNDIPSMSCVSGGKALFDSLVETVPFNGSDYKLGATSFMAYHTVLKTSKDFYEALRWARLISDNMTETLRKNSTNQSIKVFPYSVFYVFYEQYLTTWPDTLKSLGISVATIFVVTFFLLGFDIMSAFVIVITIILILTNLLGLMYWWGIALNAVALVNLVMAVGISVEFCAHITRSFAASVQPTKVLRAKESLTNMGSSVLSGITFTKFGGIVVLGFAKSEIFRIYYFKLYLCIVLFGAAHGLIFLPVFLSFAGPSLNKKKLQEYQANNQMEMRISASNTEDNITTKTNNSNNSTHM